MGSALPNTGFVRLPQIIGSTKALPPTVRCLPLHSEITDFRIRSFAVAGNGQTD